ncbi:hypothetical protein [Nocardioides baekrokdamisoli]|nr:hypothetical protein [Nocardioides baekrokdamisoli]
MSNPSSAVVIPFRRPDRNSRLRRISHGVYVPATDPETLMARARAIVANSRRGNVAVDRTAGWLHGIDTYGWSEAHDDPPLEFCAPPGGPRIERSDVRGRNRTLHPSDLMELHGVTLTTPVRTALDLGCVLRRREALAALDSFARLHGVTASDMRANLPRFRGRRGVVQLRELIDYMDPRSESPRESWLRLAIIDAGLPAPEPQVWIPIGDEPTYRLDLAYRLARVAVEYDSTEFHSTVEQRVRDERRRRDLEALGWTFIVVKEGDFQPQRLDEWTTRLRTALASTYSSRRW